MTSVTKRLNVARRSSPARQARRPASRHINAIQRSASRLRRLRTRWHASLGPTREPNRAFSKLLQDIGTDRDQHTLRRLHVQRIQHGAAVFIEQDPIEGDRTGVRSRRTASMLKIAQDAFDDISAIQSWTAARAGARMATDASKCRARCASRSHSRRQQAAVNRSIAAELEHVADSAEAVAAGRRRRRPGRPPAVSAKSATCSSSTADGDDSTSSCAERNAGMRSRANVPHDSEEPRRRRRRATTVVAPRVPPTPARTRPAPPPRRRRGPPVDRQCQTNRFRLEPMDEHRGRVEVAPTRTRRGALRPTHPT